MDAKVIGLAGQQGAGKDYMYAYLRKEMEPFEVRRMAFADGVRAEVSAEVCEALGVSLPLSGGGVWKKPYTAGQRFILQQWGTEFRREQDPEYWVKYGLDRLAEIDHHADIWCITDVRFGNEADAIREVGGFVAHVLANPEVRAQRLGISVEDLWGRTAHASEEIDFQVDGYVINNDIPELDPAFHGYLGQVRLA